MQSFIKKLSGTLFLAVFFLPALAQNKPAYEMTVNGIKVIVQPSGNEIIEVLTVFKGGVQNYPANKAGIESLAITALTECGTKKDNKNSFKDKLDKVSAEPAALWRIVASDQSNVDDQSQAAYIIQGHAQVALIHVHDLFDGVGMHAGGDVVSLSWQGQVAACDAAPHVDGQMVAYLVAKRIGCGGIDVGEARECEVFVHSRHICQAGSFR